MNTIPFRRGIWIIFAMPVRQSSRPGRRFCACCNKDDIIVD